MCQAEVANFWFVAVIQQDIGGFDVSVDDAIFVSMRQAAANA